MTVSAEMPKYKCHKEVHAFKIKAIKLDPDAETNVFLAATITPCDERYSPFIVGKEYMAKHKPIVGGYYVVYEDGYKSFSPAKAFEDGYSLVKTVLKKAITVWQDGSWKIWSTTDAGYACNDTDPDWLLTIPFDELGEQK